MELLAKTVKITNRRNVLVQIPGFVIAAWPSANELEVYYDEDKQTVTIKPKVQRGSLFVKESNRMAGASEA
jgi:hypothetical protein